MSNNRSGRLSRDAILIGASYLFPAGLGFFAIPIYYKEFSVETFNFLTICWAALGYFSFFDLGVGKTMTIILSRADRPHSKIHQHLSHIWVTNGLVWTLVVGVLVATVVSLAAPIYFKQMNRTPLELVSILLFAGSVFLGILNSYLRGIIEGKNNFLSTSINRGIVGILLIGLPLLVLGSNDVNLVCQLIFLMFIAKLFGVLQLTYSLRAVKFSRIRWRTQKFILSIGTWFSVSNFVGPLMVSGDRFFLAFLLPAQDLAIYLFIQEVLLRFLIIPTAISGALLPKLANPDSKSQFNLPQVIFIAVLLTTLTFLIFATFISAIKSILPAYTVFFDATFVVIVFVIGILSNSVGQILIVNIQVKLKQKQVAISHCMQLLGFFSLIFIIVPKWGILGASLCWTVRVIVDTLWLGYLNWKTYEPK